MTERIYCSEQNADEPMIGTADPVDVWLLLEYRPAWKAKAVEDSSLGPLARGWLDRTLTALAARGVKARPQLIRRPELDSDEVVLLIGLPGALLRFAGRGYDFLCGVDVAAVMDDPAGCERVEQPQYFVCTNGQRDVCCARFGLPVYNGLRERVGSRAWQITHLGGHRFAPNVLTLPQGVVYGRVAVHALDAFVAAVEAGELVFGHVRGRSWYTPPVQAAEALSGESNLRLVAMDGDLSAATVTFEGAGGERRVRVCQDSPVRVLKSCGDAEAKPVTPYREA